MSQYNKTILTHAGLELAKRANAGQAKFGITRAVTSADDWSHKTVQDLEEVTTIPNIMQQGTIMDTDEVESNNSVIGVSLCFTNKNLSTGYQIRIIGLYVKEEGQENDFLYAVTTAIAPEYMPSFADKVLYRFNTQMYLVIGNAQSVNVVINDGTAVTHGQLDKYKAEVTGNLKKLENTHKEDMSHVAKSASINGGAEILPDSTGKLNLVVPDPDLSRYVSLEQLGELLKAKADKVDTYTKSNIDDMHSKSYFRKQGIDQNGNAIEIRKNAIKLDNGGYAFDIWNEDWTAFKLVDVLTQLPNKADTSTVNAQITDAKNTIKSNVDNLQSAVNTKANASDVYTKKQVDDAFSSRDATIANKADKSYVNDKVGAIDFSKIKFRKQYVTGNNKTADSTWQATKNADGTYTIDLYNDDWTAQRVVDLLNQIGSKANASNVNSLQNLINQQNQTIQSLTTRLANAENEINYIKDNYVEGRRFPASQEAQAEAWENENPQRIAFITK